MTTFIPQPLPQPDPRRKNRRFFRLIHVRENAQQLALLSPPKGINLTRLNKFDEGGIEEGSIVAVSGTDVTPNHLEKRTLDDIDAFISKNLTVINDNPKNANWSNNRKMETSNNSEAIQKLAFNKRTIKILDEQLVRIKNKEIEHNNLVLKSKPFNSEDVQQKIEKEIEIVEI